MRAKLVVIGDGIAGLSLAYSAVKMGVETMVLGKNMKGTTHSATGLIAPRPDYLLSDTELVRQTALECRRWAELFGPEIIKPRHFLMLLGRNSPSGIDRIDALLSLYDKMSSFHSKDFGPHRLLDLAALEKTEPNLRTEGLLGAISLNELTVDPAVLLDEFYSELADIKLNIKDLIGFKMSAGLIEEVRVVDNKGNEVTITNGHNSLVVVNATGPWMKDISAKLGAEMRYQLYSGLQIEFPGQYFRSGIITFDKNGKYLICLQKDGTIQIGPTNTFLSGHPSQYRPSLEEVSLLVNPFLDLVKYEKISQISAKKYGFRIKPNYIDTNRPVIWRHADNGIDNFYSLHPGKMALALRAADEMFNILVSDGWVAKPSWISHVKPIHLDGNTRIKNEIKLGWLKLKSLLKLALFYAKFKLGRPQ